MVHAKSLKMELFKKKIKWGNYNGSINIHSDLKDSDIRKIIAEKKIHTIQFYEFKSPSEKTWKVLEKFFYKYPHITLSISWFDQVNFDFFRYLPSVKKLSISSYMTKDFSPIKNYVDLEELSIGETKSKAIKVNFIEHFKNLKSFYNDGMKKGFEVLANSHKLEQLTLRGVKLESLDFLIPLSKLRKIELLYGSYENITALTKIVNLQRLEISRVRKIEDFSFLNKLSALESLTIEGQTSLNKLPNLENIINLEYLGISNNRNLNDISNIEKLKSIKVLWLSYSDSQKVKEIKSLLGQAISFCLKSKSIEFSNLSSFYLTTEEDKELLTKTGIKEYREWIVNNKHKM